MLLPGTQMHIVTFIFVCIELVIFLYLAIYKLARPDDKITVLNIILIFLLIIYNVTGGLLPDPNLPGSNFVQECIAYATGFIVPSYFPYYVYKAFGLEKMRFHALRGVFLFFIVPYIAFVTIYAITNSLEPAKDIFIIPLLYAIWIIISLRKAVRYKYLNESGSYASKEEISVLFLSLTPWVGLPVIDYFNLGQVTEASVTNTGFLLLLAFQLKRNVDKMRTEHQKLVDSEKKLLSWNTNLRTEVEKRTKELERINEQKTNTFVNLAHETKTPLTLINNYLDEFIVKKGTSEEIDIIKKNIDKISNDIVNFFDLEKFNKGLAVYNHELVTNFSDLLNDNLILFREFSKRRNIEIKDSIENNVFVKADPVAINRIVNNLIENAIKFSENDCVIEITLQSLDYKVVFSVKDCGPGIPPEMHKKVFEPYYQIANQKRSTQGMGLGLPIVKKVVQDLLGDIQIDSNPKIASGTTMTVILNKHDISYNDVISTHVNGSNSRMVGSEELELNKSIYDEKKQSILILEDNISMVNYLTKKLSEEYNVFAALNGHDALIKLKGLNITPDLIISDIMMDKMDGYAFAKIISNDPAYNYIPFIFLSAKSTQTDRLQALKLGAIDFIQKPFSITELLNKIDSIIVNANKQKKAALNLAFNALQGSVGYKPSAGSDTFAQNCQLYNLTSREQEIAKLICEGTKYKDIGEALFIAERTVTKHVQNIFEKVQVSNKIELNNKLGC